MSDARYIRSFACQPDWVRWWMVVIYAGAMAWVESAAVFYLRSMMGRIEPYQADPLPVIGGFALVELPREFATMVMLFAVGVLAGRTWRARIGCAVALGGVEGTENVGEVIRVDTASVISNFDDGCRTLGSQRDGDLSVRVDCLQRVQHQVQ